MLCVARHTLACVRNSMGQGVELMSEAQVAPLGPGAPVQCYARARQGRVRAGEGPMARSVLPFKILKA